MAGFCDFGPLNATHDHVARQALNRFAGIDILPGQITGSPGNDTPESRLMRVLLLGAIADLILGRERATSCRVDHRRQLRAAAARAWIAGDAGALVSFDDACAWGFGIDAGLMRTKILKVSRRPRGLGSGKRVLGGYSV